MSRADLLATELLRRWKADYLNDAGVPYARLALELLFLIPDDFARSYKLLFERALSATDAGAEARGRAADQAGALGKAKAGAKTNGKRYKNLPLAIRDEEALALKHRIDKRLRAMGREINEELELIAMARAEGRRVKESERRKETPRCGGCKKFLSVGWRFCPVCGIRTGDDEG